MRAAQDAQAAWHSDGPARSATLAALDVTPEVIGHGASAVTVLRRPLGAVAAITPWNFPVGTVVAKVAPGLAAGCTMVVKPSPFTPLAALRLGEIARAILPPGVLNVVSGSDQVGSWMTEHPVPRMVSFTGSIATGKRIAATAAADLKRLTLELGGNDPAIVLDDVDVEEIAGHLLDNAFANCEQVCVAIKRVYVPEQMHADFVDALAARARSAQVGDGQDEQTEIGPLCNRMQFDRVHTLVEDAIRHGARPAAGGKLRYAGPMTAISVSVRRCGPRIRSGVRAWRLRSNQGLCGSTRTSRLFPVSRSAA
jgi:acyl-CoA reductase-like NAD-dependent aldehyde dehydrogenase